KRGLPHHAISIAVADGPTMADVSFGYVYDYGPGEEWVARREEGATLDGERIDPALGERRNRAGKLEVLGLESADPRWVAEVPAARCTGPSRGASAAWASERRTTGRVTIEVPARRVRTKLVCVLPKRPGTKGRRRGPRGHRTRAGESSRRWRRIVRRAGLES